MISFLVLSAVSLAYTAELDFHYDPFASPPYSWKGIDMNWKKGVDVIRIAGDFINEKLHSKGLGPAQIIHSMAIWTRPSKTNTDPKASAISYYSNNHLVLPRNQTVYECMTPMEEYTKCGPNGCRKGNWRVFATTCRPVPMRNCQANPREKKVVIYQKSGEALKARSAINDFIEKTLNPQSFEKRSYKVDVLMGVTCAYKQGDKICLDLYQQRISDQDVELRPCSQCMQKKANSSWDFEKPACHPGNPFMIN